MCMRKIVLYLGPNCVKHDASTTNIWVILYYFYTVAAAHLSRSLRNVEYHSQNGKTMSYLDSKPILSSISQFLLWQVQLTTFYVVLTLLFVHACCRHSGLCDELCGSVNALLSYHLDRHTSAAMAQPTARAVRLAGHCASEEICDGQ